MTKVEEVRVGGRAPMTVTPKIRLHLECGHYVDVKKRATWPGRYRCALCRDERRGVYV
jgi:hypothetical protein